MKRQPPTNLLLYEYALLNWCQLARGLNDSPSSSSHEKPLMRVHFLEKRARVFVRRLYINVSGT